jgi:hypothetical protein
MSEVVFEALNSKALNGLEALLTMNPRIASSVFDRLSILLSVNICINEMAGTLKQVRTVKNNRCKPLFLRFSYTEGTSANPWTHNT